MLPAPTSRAKGPIIWIACAQFFLCEQIARAGWTAPYVYRMRHNYISDLGALRCGVAPDQDVCSPWHAVMNGSFALQGFLIFVGGIVMRRFFPAGRLATIGACLVSLSGVGLTCVGAFTEDDNPGRHYAAAVEHFACADIGMVLLGVALWKHVDREPRGGYAAFTLVCGILATVSTILIPSSAHHPEWTGVIERGAAYPFVLWMVTSGIRPFARHSGHAVD